nr:sigma factor [Angustibacter aerolatus]
MLSTLALPHRPDAGVGATGLRALRRCSPSWTRAVPRRSTRPGTAVAPATPTRPRLERVRALVALAQAGDGEAFARLYERSVGPVYRYLLHRVGSPQVAEDLTSETFLRALRRIDTFTWTGRDVAAWFVTIARNLVMDHVKSSRYRLEVTTGEPARRRRALTRAGRRGARPAARRAAARRRAKAAPRAAGVPVAAVPAGAVARRDRRGAGALDRRREAGAARAVRALHREARRRGPVTSGGWLVGQGDRPQGCCARTARTKGRGRGEGALGEVAARGGGLRARADR